jgi:integrase
MLIARPTAAQAMTTALRSFLRFLQQRGDVAGDLASSVPSVARWQLASVPAILTPDDIGRLVGECDGRTAWAPTGGRASVSHVRASFNALLRLTNLSRPATARRPTLHDFRHRFAIKTLVNWYRSGADVGQTMPALCTYLGHVNINSTYRYLSAAPELLGVACDRLERQLARSP